MTAEQILLLELAIIALTMRAILVFRWFMVAISLIESIRRFDVILEGPTTTRPSINDHLNILPAPARVIFDLTIWVFRNAFPRLIAEAQKRLDDYEALPNKES
jgi:hypothetical protein